MKKIIFVNFVFLVLLIFLIEITLRIVFSYNVQGISKDLINKNISYRFNTPNLDYAKAFDKRDYGLLVQKLEKYGFPPILIQWIKSFLIGRTQTVVVNGTHNFFFSIF